MVRQWIVTPPLAGSNPVVRLYNIKNRIFYVFLAFLIFILFEKILMEFFLILFKLNDFIICYFRCSFSTNFEMMILF